MSFKIMIIEDDLDTQFLFSEILNSEGFSVISKSNGKEALEFLNSNPVPDLIFMDLNFPEGTPEEFTKELANINGGKEVPIILVSGSADIAFYAQKLGAKGFLRKPFEIDPLLNIIQDVI